MTDKSLREALEGRGWALETMELINKLTPDIKGKAFDPDWFLLRQRLEQMEAALAAQPSSPQQVSVTSSGPQHVGGDRIITVEQVEKIHEIIENYSTDVVDYELATDNINAVLWPNAAQPTPSLERNWTVEAGALATNSLPEALREIERAVPTSTGESPSIPPRRTLDHG